MIKIKDRLNSVRIRLFLALGIAVMVIIFFLIILNNVVLETFYLYSKRNSLRTVYDTVNTFYNSDVDKDIIGDELRKIEIYNDFEILIKNKESTNVFVSNKEFLFIVNETNLTNRNSVDNRNILFSNSKMIIRQMDDFINGEKYMVFTGTLDNGYKLYMRLPISSIRESVKISNNFLYLIGGFTIILAAIIISFISKRFTEPILELNEIANKMSKLDFSKKYRITDTDDEINALGKSINIMSDKLERTIKQLRNSNIELEKDIEEKSKIDEMRKQFISDVSHELKTPIALIQGYAEGLVENVNSDEESKTFYSEVILDEANKMDKIVKQLLELMKLEYGKREFNNEKIDIVELIKNVIRASQVLIDEKQVEVKFENKKPIYVYADEFYIERVLSNYFINAIKHAKKVNSEKSIKIYITNIEEKEKVRIHVFNTGEKIEEENINRIWQRFYKVDTSRNRKEGGTGIGLSLVKAIMNNYNNDFGVSNLENGVDFYFDLDIYVEEEN